MSIVFEAVRESLRDMEESAFTPILRSLLGSTPGIQAVVFVDGQGECIDYCSMLPPFDAKVIAATMQVALTHVRSTSWARAGEPWFLHVHGDERDMLVRRVGDEYAIVVVTRSTGLSSLLEESVERAVRELRVEGGMSAPAWEPRTDRIRVEIRLSTTGWAYAPKAYWVKGNRVPIADVIGRWVETEGSTDGSKDAICFMVRTEKGHELTLVHLVSEDSWELR